MDYEHFLKIYNKDSQFFSDSDSPGISSSTQLKLTTYSSLNTSNIKNTSANLNHSPIRKRINERAISGGGGCTDNCIQNEVLKGKSTRSYSTDYGTDNNKRVGLVNESRSYFNYPIISPPPGFQDEVLMSGKTETRVAKESSIRLCNRSSPSRFEKKTYSLDEGASDSYNFYENGGRFSYYHKGNEQSGLNYNSDARAMDRSVLYPSKRDHLINSHDSIPVYNSFDTFREQTTDITCTNIQQYQSRAVKSCSDNANQKGAVTCSKWCNSTVVPASSFPADNYRHYYECKCYHCDLPLSPETKIVSSERSSVNYDDRRTSTNPNLLSRQREARRSTSFQNSRTNPQIMGTNGYGYNTINWGSYYMSNRKPIYMTFNDEFDGNRIYHYNADADYYTSDCYDDENEDEIFYLPENEELTCTCSSPYAVDDNLLEEISTYNIRQVSKSRSKSDQYKECYPTTQTDITGALEPPDIANVIASLDCNYMCRDVEFRRKQPDILQNTYHRNRASSVCSENVDKYYGFPEPNVNENQKPVEVRKKSCSLPKSFQRPVSHSRGSKQCNNPTIFYHWKKYGFKGLFLNRRLINSSIMSKTAPTTPVKDMPEKRRYGRLLKVDQYSSSPTLDHNSMKHMNMNFDCDTKYKRNKFKTNNPASLNTNDFRPSSQENIVSGDGIFHKFCKNFSLHFLRKPTDQDDVIHKHCDSSPMEIKIMKGPDEEHYNRLGSSAWRLYSDRGKRMNISNNKFKLEDNHIYTHPLVEPKIMSQRTLTHPRIVRRTLSDLNQYSAGVNEKTINQLVPSKHKAQALANGRKYKECSLRRSTSQPLLNNKNSPAVHKKAPPYITTCSEDERVLFSEDDMMSDSGGSSLLSRKNSMEKGINEDIVIFAEAVWDHVAIESEELPFRAGDVIEVYNILDREWWWGMCNEKSGWFPSDFVRLRVNQEKQRCSSESTTKQNTSMSSKSNEQVRSQIISELLNTEKDFVKILTDVKEAFITECEDAKELFSNEQLYKIFGNWQQISAFQVMFLENLEVNLNEQCPHKTCVGECFLKFREHFCIYSDYCNNHPLSIATLQQLYQDEKYRNFFENCRASKNLMAIPLDGFLLMPVQRICKYPLQLAELLKHTEVDHDDFNAVQNALNAMREVAVLINERKRRMESLEKLVLWQQRVEGWDGSNLIENSSQLIYQNDVTKVFAGMWTTNVTLFLFDHQIVFCKKDILKRDFYLYKGRISLDGCEIIDVSDGKDTLLGTNIRNGLRIQNSEENKWLLFFCRTQREKDEWMNAFRKEKELILMDERNKLEITPMDRQLAYITATTCNKHIFLKHKNKKFKKTIIHASQFRNPSSPYILGRKVGTWFMFGANRKNHRFVSKNPSII